MTMALCCWVGWKRTLHITCLKQSLSLGIICSPDPWWLQRLVPIRSTLLWMALHFLAIEFRIKTETMSGRSQSTTLPGMNSRRPAASEQRCSIWSAGPGCCSHWRSWLQKSAWTQNKRIENTLRALAVAKALKNVIDFLPPLPSSASASFKPGRFYFCYSTVNSRRHLASNIDMHPSIERQSKVIWHNPVTSGNKVVKEKQRKTNVTWQ